MAFVLVAAWPLAGCDGQRAADEPAPQGIVLTAPTGHTLRPGEDLQLDYRVVYAKGVPLGTAYQKQVASEIVWVIAPVDGATVSSSGVFKASASGSYTVTARLRSFEDSVDLRVKGAFTGRYTGTLRYGDGYFAPWEFTVADDGTATGKMKATHAGNWYQYRATFKGSVRDDGTFNAMGPFDTDVGGGNWIRSFCSISGKIVDGKFTGTFDGVNQEATLVND